MDRRFQEFRKKKGPPRCNLCQILNSIGRSHSCLVLTTPGRAGSGVASLSWPARNISPAPLLTGNATVDGDKMGVRTCGWRHARTEPRASRATHPSSEDLIDGGALFQSALRHYFGSHLLHVQHESVQRLLDVGLFVLFLLGRDGRLSAEREIGGGGVRGVLGVGGK